MPLGVQSLAATCCAPVSVTWRANLCAAWCQPLVQPGVQTLLQPGVPPLCNLLCPVCANLVLQPLVHVVCTCTRRAVRFDLCDRRSLRSSTVVYLFVHLQTGKFKDLEGAHLEHPILESPPRFGQRTDRETLERSSFGYFL